MSASHFATHGIEIEYMIVDQETLDVRPWCDRLLDALAGGGTPDEVTVPPLGWSNELALHVIEVKTAEPVPALLPMAAVFQEQIQAVNRLLAADGACLMPTAMHPWMDPAVETRLWPHQGREIYTTFDRIFDCRRHGWANLQSSHLNLPFHDETSFLALHHALRLILPVLPAVAASSPVIDGRANGSLNHRLEVYRDNCARMPSVTGRVIPEPVRSMADYRATILQPMYAAMTAVEPSGVLSHEWLNARGAITRFDRNTIEVRVLDAQECPFADLALQSTVACLAAHLITTCDPATLAAVPQDALVELYDACIRRGREAKMTVPEVAGLTGAGRVTTIGDLWQAWLEGPALSGLEAEAGGHLRSILEEGCLASRMLAALGGDTSRASLRKLYRRLASCLDDGQIYHP